ncbi:3-oxoacyl-[acyl-carrier-protein] synthase III C-terminal domain-containing protein [Hyphococcus luteus]|uniref:3-hydroxy-3-methylglutaryl CoA synthase n=1 Tax=Hyphococcus luteus TaxID=2058213 RepID=A0A2S7K4G7_9PROT|nr:3-oxoacyl-[acyl-carrier-protein] synthase III C-terminal domain-containing protein [Marinicaulis flavus]PQA87392.1 3-hydroxy-3-methylglutaryl CoA synthase [Marinicaulis flavus]
MVKGDETTGITSFGVYIPSMRLQRKALANEVGWINPALNAYGSGVRAICDFDEDVITMAVEAVRHCNDAQALGEISAIVAASTTFPFTDRLNASVVAPAAGLSDSVQAVDIASTQRAGVSAFRVAERLCAVDGASRQVLCVAADRRRGRPGSLVEMTSADAAAAFLFGNENVIARVVAHKVSTVDFVDHYRRANEAYEYGWEERWIRDEGYRKIAPPVLTSVMEAAGISAEDIDHFIFSSTIRGVAAGLAKAIDIRDDAVRDDFQDVMGEAGAAHPLLMLADTLCAAGAGEKILIAGFGQGCEAMVLETTPLIESVGVRHGVRALAQSDHQIDLPFIRYLSFNGQLDPDFGPRAETDRKTALSAAYRHANEVARLIAGKCEKCGTVQFPKAKNCVNPNCGHEGEQTDHALAQESAIVKTVTTDWLGFSRNPPNRYGMVEFESGARMIMNFTSALDEPPVGSEVSMVYRIQDFDPYRKYHRYSWKARTCVTPYNGEKK